MESPKELWLRQIKYREDRRVWEYEQLEREADVQFAARMLGSTASARPFDDWCVCGEPTRNGLCDRCDAADRGELYP